MNVTRTFAPVLVLVTRLFLCDGIAVPPFLSSSLVVVPSVLNVVVEVSDSDVSHDKIRKQDAWQDSVCTGPFGGATLRP
jgi:hypothetical protein